MRISDWSSYVCSSDLHGAAVRQYISNLRVLEQRIYRHMNKAGPRASERHQASESGLSHPACHACAWFLDYGPQSRRVLTHRRIQHGVIQLAETSFTSGCFACPFPAQVVYGTWLLLQKSCARLFV